MQGFRKDIDNLAFPPLKTKSIQSDEKEKMKQPQQYTPKQLPNEYSWSKVLQKHNQNILRPPPKRRQPFIDWDNINPPTHLFGDSKILYTFPNLSNSQQPPRTISHFPLLPLKPNHGPPQCVKSPMPQPWPVPRPRQLLPPLSLPPPPPHILPQIPPPPSPQKLPLPFSLQSPPSAPLIPMPQKLLDHRPTMMPPFCNSNSSPKIENSTKKSSPETPPESPIKIDKLSLLWNTFDFFPFLIREQFETPNDFKLCLQLVRILGIRTTRQMFPGIPDNIIKTVIIYEAYTN